MLPIFNQAMCYLYTHYSKKMLFLFLKNKSELFMIKWISQENSYNYFADIPKSISQARAMQHFGILPTHVFQLIPPFSPLLYELNMKKASVVWLHYRRHVLPLREAYKYNLKVSFLFANKLIFYSSPRILTTIYGS